MLVDVAAAAGADRTEAHRFLASGDGLAEIRAANRKLRELGVSGIPMLILGGKYQLASGALGSGTLVHAFRRIEEQGGATGSMFAEALEIPEQVLEETI